MGDTNIHYSKTKMDQYGLYPTFESSVHAYHYGYNKKKKELEYLEYWTMRRYAQTYNQSPKQVTLLKISHH
jgi:hypothetical protein